MKERRIALDQEKIEQNVIEMREIAEQLNKITVELETAIEQKKEFESIAFLQPDGSIKDKEHKASTCTRVLKLNPEISRLKGLKDELRLKFRVCEIESDLFRSINAQNRLERKLYENYS